MVAMIKEFLFDFTDLKLSILCKNCNTEVIIDASKPPIELPKKCGPCKYMFDDTLVNAIQYFCAACSIFSDKKVERPVMARIRMHSELKIEI